MLTPDELALKRRQLATLAARSHKSPETLAAIDRLTVETADAPADDGPSLADQLAAAEAVVAALERRNAELVEQLAVARAAPAPKAKRKPASKRKA